MMTDDSPTEEELEQSYSDTPRYTVTLNGTVYELNEDAREAIQRRAEHEYSENPMFSCYWKTANEQHYADGAWDDTVHSQGDAVLVIETSGPYVPWEKLDELNVEMQEVGPESQLDREMDQQGGDSGTGVKTIDPSEVDNDVEREVGRTHFSLTPQQFEEVPDPDGEEADKIPAKPVELGEDASLIAWIPENPEVDHCWSAGEAISSMHNRVEWNVQVKANQPRLGKDKDTSHDHWESILKSHGCEKVAEVGQSQRTSSGSSGSSKSEEEVAEKFKNGKAGGGHWRI